ncbi:hypothetical protein BGZ52_011745, partial [Haplosporangium bisporale]
WRRQKYIDHQSHQGVFCGQCPTCHSRGHNPTRSNSRQCYHTYRGFFHTPGEPRHAGVRDQEGACDLHRVRHRRACNVQPTWSSLAALHPIFG